MTVEDPGEVKRFIVDFFSDALLFGGIEPDEVPDDLDLLQSGIVDSMGVLEMIVALEERFGIEIDLEELPPDELVAIGPLSEFVARQGGRVAG